MSDPIRPQPIICVFLLLGSRIGAAVQGATRETLLCRCMFFASTRRCAHPSVPAPGQRRAVHAMSHACWPTTCCLEVALTQCDGSHTCGSGSHTSQGSEASSVYFLLEGEVEIVADVPLTQVGQYSQRPLPLAVHSQLFSCLA